MKKFIFLFVLVFNIGFTKGQTTFFKTISGGTGTESSYIEQTTDGGYLIVGRDYSPTDVSGYVVKTNSVGDTIWTKIYGTNTTFKSAEQTFDGGYILVGTIGNSSSSNIYVLKIDSVGSIQWQQNIGGSSSEEGTYVKQTTDGGFIITGYGKSLGAGNDDIYIIKLDAAGNIQWDNILGLSTLDQGYSIEETSDGGFIAVGVSGAQTYLLKLNNLGVLQWTKTYGEASFFYKGKGVIQTSDNGYIILGGRRNSSSVINDVTLIKTDSLGNINWSKAYSGSIADNDFSFKKTTDGNYIVASSTTSHYSLLYSLIDSVGNLLWGRFINGIVNYGSFASQTSDGGYVFTGYMQTAAVGGGVYFIKTDSLGNNGCIDSTATIIVNTFAPTITSTSLSSTSGITLNVSSLFMSSRGRVITTSCTSVGINELPSTPKISVYPNPSSGQFNCSGLEKESKIEVFDMTGKIIYQSIANGDFETINISEKAKGIYFYRITKEMKLLQSGKIALE